MAAHGTDSNTRFTGRRVAIAVALILGLILAGAAAAALLAHPSLSAATGDRTQADEQAPSSAACHDPFVAEVVPDARGHDFPSLAARAWAMTTEYYPDAPTTGWKPNSPSSARSGNWQISSTKTKHSGWVVSQLTCL